jgi:hypothetical protein
LGLCCWFCVYDFVFCPAKHYKSAELFAARCFPVLYQASSAQPRRRPAKGSLCFFYWFCVKVKKQRSATDLQETKAAKNAFSKRFCVLAKADESCLRQLKPSC